MRLFLLTLFLLSQCVIVGQDSCAVFGNDNVQPRMMGYVPEPMQWEEIDYVYHIYYTVINGIVYRYVIKRERELFIQGGNRTPVAKATHAI